MREKILFNEDWVFHRGDIAVKTPTAKGPIYMQAKTERMKWGPACKDYRVALDDFSPDHEMKSDRWEAVNLPHDFVITQIPDPNENNGLGYFKYENAWYRKTFTLAEKDKNKRITLLFDGIATHATVYLNGCLMKHNFCGYTSFEVNISDVVKFGEENVLAVYVNTQNHEGWWYEGGGIYRHVWLIKTDLVAVDLWGVYVAPKKLEGESWRVDIETTVLNDRYTDVAVRLTSSVVDREGNVVAVASGEGMIPYQEKCAVRYSVTLENPNLWDLERPYLYEVVTIVEADGQECDRYTTRFGFRTIVADPNEGLFVNGKYVKIKGVCGHQDFGLTGKAVADNIHRYKMELVKEMGANGYRTSHYPQTEALMDALDELGFLVMDEVRWFESTDEGMEQLEMLIKRDRNRPSVVFWSVGNEEPFHITEQGSSICKRMMARIRKLDDTRLIMTAVSNDPDIATVYDELEDIGINYNLDKFDKIHEKYPHKPIFSSECCATGTTRGWYLEDSQNRSYMSAYDKDANNWFLGRERTWKFISERKWVLGAYQWIAFEHRGETIWPRLCSQSGAIDLFLQKKDAFYQNQAHWIEDTPVVHLLPHWNWQGREGELIGVWCYTNCGELELFLNGKSLGRKMIEQHGHGEWKVEYLPGTIEVIGYCDGKQVASDLRQTTGRPVRLQLRLENTISKANGQDVAVVTCYCVDAEGREVPDASPFVQFDTNSLGRVIGTGSDIADHIPVTCTDRKMRAGRISVAVQVGKKLGQLKVYAQSENLLSAVLTIELV